MRETNLMKGSRAAYATNNVVVTEWVVDSGPNQPLCSPTKKWVKRVPVNTSWA